MSKELIEQGQQVVAEAIKLGASDVRAALSHSRERSVEWRDGKLDRLRESTGLSMRVELYVDGRYSSNSTSDLRPQAVTAFLSDAIGSTRLMEPDPHRKLPDPARYGGRFEGDLALYDDATAEVAVDEQRRLARQLEEAARAAPGADRIISVTSGCSSDIGESALVTSNGLEVSRRGTSCSLVVESAVRGEGERKPDGWWYAVRRRRDQLPDLAELGARATQRAVRDIGAKPEPSGRYACVIENLSVRRLLGQLLSPLNGRAIQQQRSFLADKLGQKVASDLFTLRDEPHLLGGLGSRTYDSEGMTMSPRLLFEKGVLRGFLIDTYYGSKLGREPTSGDTSNLVFTPGTRDLDGLLKKMGQGILITGFSGGNSNEATGDFSIGVSGLWVEKGEVARPISGMNLAGNHLTFWKQLAELGNDPFLSASAQTPSMRFKPVQFSGS